MSCGEHYLSKLESEEITQCGLVLGISKKESKYFRSQVGALQPYQERTLIGDISNFAWTGVVTNIMAVSALHSVTGTDHIAEKKEGKNQGKEDRTEMEQEIKRYMKERKN